MTTSKNIQERTAGQLERLISQKVQAFYRTQLGHQPSRVTCQLFDAKLAIVIEDSVTQPEQLLAEEGQLDLAEQVRSDLDKVLRPQLIQLIEEVLSVGVLDLLSDATLDTGRTGMIVVLDDTPNVRNPTAIPKAKRSRDDNSTSGTDAKVSPVEDKNISSS